MTVLKDITLEEREKLVAWSIEKAGRTISAKNEEKLQAACDHMKEATTQVEDILSALEGTTEPAATDETKDEKAIVEEDFFTKLANQIKTTTQQQAAIIRNQKEQKAVQDTTLSFLQQLSGEIGGEK